ncbi:MAG: hypothetical protein AUJ12_05245 [Alphaproteobacteria bacterium CG1_02_46_17]|nr:MAG: hypothetical protein AUJ12_05245 [Alphaproteobacteria bacterium CG1_02_46_17]
MMKCGLRYFCLMIALGTIGFGSVVHAADVPFNEIKFAKSDWAPELIQALTDGPAILSKDEQFDIVPAPANDSESTKQDLDYLRAIAKTERTADEIEKIEWENRNIPLSAFERDGLIDLAKNDDIRLFSLKTDREISYFILSKKMEYGRARPSQLATDLETVIPNPPHASYPSGHAGQSWMVALVLSEIDPVNAEKFKNQAIDIAHRREIAGVHYPADSAAGRDLAEKVFAKLLAVPEYKQELEKVKTSYVVTLK